MSDKPSLRWVQLAMMLRLQTPDSRRLQTSYAKSLGGNKRFLDIVRNIQHLATVLWIFLWYSGYYKKIHKMDERSEVSPIQEETKRIDVLMHVVT